jgi:hypothetical protein
LLVLCEVRNFTPGCYGKHCYRVVFSVRYTLRLKSIDYILCGVRAEETGVSSVQHNMAQPDISTLLDEIKVWFDLGGQTQLNSELLYNRRVLFTWYQS